jgi:hypothetical protein
MQPNIHFWSYLARFFLEWEMFRTKVLQKIKHILYCENCALYDVIWKNTVEPDRPQMTIWGM